MICPQVADEGIDMVRMHSVIRQVFCLFDVGLTGYSCEGAA